MDRNNTNFPVALFEHFKNTKFDTKYSFLKYYQNVVRSYMADVKIKTRGLLVIHEMGLGKSILGVAVAIDSLPRPVVLLSAKSLHGNMTKSIYKYVKMRTAVEPDFFLGGLPRTDLDAWIARNFSFVSMNASNMLAQMNATSDAGELDAALDKRFGDIARVGSLDGKMLIIDEAHNFFRAITNGSKNAIGLYEMIRRAKNLRVIFLTGTPIANNPFELAVCFNMLSYDILLPESYSEFNKLYVNGVTIRNRGKFQNRLFGLVSYVGNKSTPGAALGIHDNARAEFPTELDMIVERVNMDASQYVQYQLARDKEREESNRRTGVYGGPGHGSNIQTPNLTKPKSSASSTYRVKSRQLGNFAPIGVELSAIPVGDLGSAKYRQILANINKHPNTIGLVYSQFTGVGGLATFAAYLESQGWKRWQPSAKTGGDDTKLLSLNSLLDAEYDPEYIHAIDSGPELPSVSAFFDNIAEQAKRFNGGHVASGSWDVDDLDAYYGESYFGSDDHELPDPPKRKSMANYEDCDRETCCDRSNARVNKSKGLSVSYSVESKFPNYVLRVFDGDTDIGSITINYSRDSNGALTAGKVTDINVNSIIDPAIISAAITRVISRRSNYAGCAEDTTINASLADPRLVPDRSRTFALITGDVAVETREAVQAAYNLDENKHGGEIDLMLVSSTGAEGLDLKNGRHVHIMEMYWDWRRIAQIVARLVRNNSHVALPPGERNVQPYLYLAVPPASEKLSDGSYPLTTDVELYNEAIHDQLLITAFNEALHEVSIECMVNACKNCRVCNPTNSRLFTDDPLKDTVTADPCTQIEERTVDAEPITVDGVTYYYAADDTSLYNYRVYVHDTAINGYRPLSEADPRYTKVIDAIVAQA